MEDLTGMNVAQRPIVDPRPHQVIQRAGSVRRMTGVRAYVGVQESDGKGRTFNLNKALHEVFVDIPGGIADAVNQGALRFIAEQRNRFKISAEPMAAIRVRQLRFPPVPEGHVAMANEDRRNAASSRCRPSIKARWARRLRSAPS